jgi:hypothetical protein
MKMLEKALLGTRRNAQVKVYRKFAETDVEFIHYVERLHMDAEGPLGHAETKKVKPEEHHHH